jgi:outer membrane protein assembly factor BamE (lipoprotein component of BamABCDE complex)
MPLSATYRRIVPLAAAAALGLVLAGCSGMALTQNKQRGYALTEDQIIQVRPGQSAALVTAVLGSPQATNNFGTETAWYYIGEKVEQTAFGLEIKKERTVLAVYLDKNDKVVDTERLGVQDGKVFTIESRRTPSYGQDRTFLESIIASF